MKQKTKRTLTRLSMWLACGVIALIVIATKPEPQTIKTPMPTVDDAAVNREYEPLKTGE